MSWLPKFLPVLAVFLQLPFFNICGAGLAFLYVFPFLCFAWERADFWKRASTSSPVFLWNPIQLQSLSSAPKMWFPFCWSLFSSSAILSWTSKLFLLVPEEFPSFGAACRWGDFLLPFDLTTSWKPLVSSFLGQLLVVGILFWTAFGKMAIFRYSGQPLHLKGSWA